MESVVLFLIGAGTLFAGSRLLARSRKTSGTRGAVGGTVLVFIGAILLVGGFWSMGTLVGEDGTDIESPAGEATP